MERIIIADMKGSEKQISYALDLINKPYSRFIEWAEKCASRSERAKEKGNFARAEEAAAQSQRSLMAADLYRKMCSANESILRDAAFVINSLVVCDIETLSDYASGNSDVNISDCNVTGYLDVSCLNISVE